MTSAVLLLLCASAGAQASSPCPAANGSREDPTYPIRKLAFEAITAGDSPLARHLMRCAIHANSADLVALRQEVYLDLAAGDDDGAAEDIDALRALNNSTPQFEAQQGYIFAKQKKYDAARAAFTRAIGSTSDEALIEQWRKAIANIDAEDPNHALAFSLDSQYLNRFEDGVVDAQLRFYQRLRPGLPVRAYANARLLRDTASNVSSNQFGLLPQIFSDNAFLAGVGLAYQPRGSHFALTSEANLAYTFFGSKNHSAATVSDFRTVAGYYRVIRPGEDPTGLHVLPRFSFQANGSVGFYSRYQHDVIAYLQPQETFDLVRAGPIRASPFFQQSFALDSNQQFYNNIAELIPGLELSLPRLPGIALRTEYVRGFYLPFADQTQNPYGSTYSDVRVRLTFGKTLILHGRGR